MYEEFVLIISLKYMADVLTPEQRSRCMAAIRGKDTKPEILVRKFLFNKGLRYRLNNRKLPGSPDIVLKKYKTVIFVDGCFWHGHDCRNTRPAENKEYWQKKCERNMKHDKDVTAMFEARGWKVLRIWECELKKRNETILVEKIQSILSRSSERTQR